MMELAGKGLDLERDGYIAVADLLTAWELACYLERYDKILSGEIEAGQWRSDLGSGKSRKQAGVENITQVMWPSELIPELLTSPAHVRALEIVRQLLGDDMAFDFDMLIDKAPGTETPTPFHQDMAYWIDLPDRRALSCWLALDEATVENGGMWFKPGSHRLPLRKHRSGTGAGIRSRQDTQCPRKQDVTRRHEGTACPCRGPRRRSNRHLSRRRCNLRDR